MPALIPPDLARPGPATPPGAALMDLAAPMRELLIGAIRCPSVSGREGDFTRLIDGWARGAGFETDLWQADERSLGAYPQSRARHLPLAGRPTLVVRLPGRKNASAGGGLLFNAHADVVAAPQSERWSAGPWSGTERDGCVFGRGACDVKGPLVSALWAMLALKRAYPAGLARDVALELVPGEEDCVGLGTLTSAARGHRADASIVLEPTEGLPRCASRGGARFEIGCAGRAVHGTVKWLGRDALAELRRVLDALEALERAWNDRAADSLFAPYPLARPITVDRVEGGDWQGMVCDRATCAGYLELLPGDDPESWRPTFEDGLRRELARRGGDPAAVTVTFPETYAGHRTDPDGPLCRLAERACRDDPSLAWAGWAGFNSGCEAGLRAGLYGTPTLVWGPGSLAQAHAVDEFVRWDDVARAAGLFARFTSDWTAATEVR